MSRIGKHPVEIPSGVDVKVDGQRVTAKGKRGELSLTVDGDVEVSRENGSVVVKPRSTSKRARAMWGTSRSLLEGLIRGVDEGYVYNLEITGVGYRAAVEGRTLALQLGYSHDVRYPIPDGVEMKCERPTHISITGANKQQLGQIAAEIRAFRPPEPYKGKGKGIRYEGEHILRKEGKKK